MTFSPARTCTFWGSPTWSAHVDGVGVLDARERADVARLRGARAVIADRAAGQGEAGDRGGEEECEAWGGHGSTLRPPPQRREGGPTRAAAGARRTPGGGAGLRGVRSRPPRPRRRSGRPPRSRRTPRRAPARRRGRPRRPGSTCSAEAPAEASPGTYSLPQRIVTISSGPPAAGATTGRPAASASTSARPNGSAIGAVQQAARGREGHARVCDRAEELDASREVLPRRACAQRGDVRRRVARQRRAGEVEPQVGDARGDLQREVGPLPRDERAEPQRSRGARRRGRDPGPVRGVHAGTDHPCPADGLRDRAGRARSRRRRGPRAGAARGARSWWSVTSRAPPSRAPGGGEDGAHARGHDDRRPVLSSQPGQVGGERGQAERRPAAAAAPAQGPVGQRHDLVPRRRGRGGQRPRRAREDDRALQRAAPVEQHPLGAAEQPGLRDEQRGSHDDRVTGADLMAAVPARAPPAAAPGAARRRPAPCGRRRATRT